MLFGIRLYILTDMSCCHNVENGLIYEKKRVILNRKNQETRLGQINHAYEFDETL